MQSNKWRGKIDHVTEIARRESSTLESLGLSLEELAASLEQNRSSALAFIASTAAQSCQAHCIDEIEGRIGVVDLCERLLDALESSKPFDFGNANSALTALLFPENPHADSALEIRRLNTDSSAKSESAEMELPDGLLETCMCTDEQLLREFLSEANEHIQNIESLMLRLEIDPADQESINELFRAVHSLKGSAGVLELNSLGAISHLTESVLVRVRDGKIGLSSSFEVILAAADAMAAQVASLTEAKRSRRALEYPVPPDLLLQCLDSVRVTGQCSNENLLKLKTWLSKHKVESSRQESKSQLLADSMRVDGKRLEQLIDLIGELVIADAMVQRELSQRESAAATSVATRLRKVIREIQQLSLTLKMVPIGSVFQKMNRMVRDLSAKLDKQVELQIVGADTEVDKALLERIADPLVHMIRNSLDHGIEPTAAERIAAGKPAVASIRLEAHHRAGNIHLRISDDGRGLNRKRILARAVERGLVDVSATLSDAEVEDLIFEPGFSTATEVTEISGRGVGMDVVRKNVESMRGTIRLTSREGKGTDISLELPLSLSIIDGTVVRVGERNFIIPTLSVIEQVQIATLEFSGSDECRLVQIRSRFLSVKWLGDVLGTSHSRSLKHGQVVMLVESGGQQHALIVDELLGQQQIVIKPLGAMLAGVNYFVGGALLSDGQIGFVLDLNAICTSNT